MRGRRLFGIVLLALVGLAALSYLGQSTIQRDDLNATASSRDPGPGEWKTFGPDGPVSHPRVPREGARRVPSADDPRVDAALDRKTMRKIVYNETGLLDYRKDTLIRIAVAGESIESARREMIGLEGETTESEAELTQRVLADLSPDNSNVKIRPAGEVEKTIRTGVNTYFDFYVRPEMLESFLLTFTLTNIAYVDGVRHNDKPDAWFRVVKVKVGTFAWLEYQWDRLGLLWKILGALASLLGLWLAIVPKRSPRG